MPSGTPRLVLLLNTIPTTLLGTPPIPSLKNGEASMYMHILHVDVRTKANCISSCVGVLLMWHKTTNPTTVFAFIPEPLGWQYTHVDSHLRHASTSHRYSSQSALLLSCSLGPRVNTHRLTRTLVSHMIMITSHAVTALYVQRNPS